MQKEKRFFFFIPDQMEQRGPKTCLIGRVVTFEDEVNESKFSGAKFTNNRAQNKRNEFLFYAEME